MLRSGRTSSLRSGRKRARSPDESQGEKHGKSNEELLIVISKDLVLFCISNSWKGRRYYGIGA